MVVANIILEGRFGGPQHRILQVAERLKARGVRTVVVAPRRDSDVFLTALQARGVDVRRLSLHRLSRPLWRNVATLALFVPELLSLVSVLKRERVDLVHCNTAWQYKGVLAGRLAGCKVVVHLNAAWLPGWMRLLSGLLGSVVDGFIVTGQRVEEAYFVGLNRRLTDKPRASIQAPVDTTRAFNPAFVQADVPLAADPSVKIATVGNINPSKGFEHFIAMAGLLSRDHANLSFHIVGPDLSTQRAYSSRLRALTDRMNLRNLVFHGQSHDVASVLKAVDVFVCTSITESGPMSVWEAMAMEKAVVSTDVGDVARYVRDGENGFVVPPGDPEALASRVARLVVDSDLRARMGKKARQTAEQQLDIGLCAEKHRSFYQAVLNGDAESSRERSASSRR